MRFSERTKNQKINYPLYWNRHEEAAHRVWCSLGIGIRNRNFERRRCREVESVGERKGGNRKCVLYGVRECIHT